MLAPQQPPTHPVKQLWCHLHSAAMTVLPRLSRPDPPQRRDQEVTAGPRPIVSILGFRSECIEITDSKMLLSLQFVYAGPRPIVSLPNRLGLHESNAHNVASYSVKPRQEGAGAVIALQILILLFLLHTQTLYRFINQGRQTESEVLLHPDGTQTMAWPLKA